MRFLFKRLGVAVAAAAVVVWGTGCHPMLRTSRQRVVDRVPYTVAFDGVPGPTGLTVDLYGNLYVSQRGSQGSVMRISPSGERQDVITGLGAIRGLARDDRGNVYVVTAGLSMAGGSHGVYRISDDGRRKLLVKGLSNPVALAVDEHDRLFITEDLANGRILRYADDELLTWAERLQRPRGIAAGREGAIFTAEATTGQLIRLTPDGLRHVLIPEGILQEPEALFYSGLYRGVFIVEGHSKGRLLFASVDGAIVSLLYDLKRPSALTMDVEGNLFIAETGRNRILRVPNEPLVHALDVS